jgi:hypothetical protein
MADPATLVERLRTNADHCDDEDRVYFRVEAQLMREAANEVEYLARQARLLRAEVKLLRTASGFVETYA